MLEGALALRIMYYDKLLSFRRLLEKDSSVIVHHRNITNPATETYKFLKGLSPSFMNEILVERNNSYGITF